MPVASAEFPYERGTATTHEIQRAVNQVLSDLATTPDAADSLSGVGLDNPVDIGNVEVHVADREAGADPFATTILIQIIGPIAVHIATSLWSDVILPALQRRLGLDAIGAPLDE